MFETEEFTFMVLVLCYTLDNIIYLFKYSISTMSVFYNRGLLSPYNKLIFHLLILSLRIALVIPKENIQINNEKHTVIHYILGRLL
ncbi:hypothetical protein BDF21DRAFT_428413 [Thamnidium elegans]|nr:hypothetical protein BDF21DRAFT_429466 [Thamnidium elegans]KAI8062969.1 hypothetical protein BDF21DRAFT_428413 [Thamnidium elegans]